MLLIRLSFGKLNFRFVLTFSAALLLAVPSLVPGARAQEPASPNADAPPQPVPAVFQNPIAPEQLAFLKDYAGQPAKDVVKNKRFAKLIKQVIPKSEFHYGKDMPLSEASDVALYGSKLPVVIRDGRYAMIAGKQGPYLDGRGFLWFDLEEGIALGGFYFHPVNGEPTPTLAIFSRQLPQNPAGLSELPLAFAEDLGRWAVEAGLPPVTPRYFIPENGKKYVLLHDEDFCDHPASAPAPPQAACLQMNANAADADLSAAEFMRQTHNAANATAWMLSPEQVSWIGFRDQTCGLGPSGLPCRIRITRQRTRAIIHAQPPARRS